MLNKVNYLVKIFDKDHSADHSKKNVGKISVFPDPDELLA